MNPIEQAIRDFIALLLADTGAECEVNIQIIVRAGKGKGVPMKR